MLQDACQHINLKQYELHTPGGGWLAGMTQYFPTLIPDLLKLTFSRPPPQSSLRGGGPAILNQSSDRRQMVTSEPWTEKLDRGHSLMLALLCQMVLKVLQLPHVASRDRTWVISWA